MNNIGESNPYLNFVFYAKYLCTKKLNHIFLGHFVAFSGTFFHFFLGQNFCFLGCNFTKIFSGKKLLSRALFGLFLDFFSGIFDFLAQNFQFFLGQCWLFLAQKKKLRFKEWTACCAPNCDAPPLTTTATAVVMDRPTSRPTSWSKKVLWFFWNLAHLKFTINECAEFSSFGETTFLWA